MVFIMSLVCGLIICLIWIDDDDDDAVIASVERFAYKGVASNLVTYLTDVVNFSNSSAAKSLSSWVGFTSMLPLISAILADSYWDRYYTIVASSFIYVVVWL